MVCRVRNYESKVGCYECDEEAAGDVGDEMDPVSWDQSNDDDVKEGGLMKTDWRTEVVMVVVGVVLLNDCLVLMEVIVLRHMHVAVQLLLLSADFHNVTAVGGSRGDAVVDGSLLCLRNDCIVPGHSCCVSCNYI